MMRHYHEILSRSKHFVMLVDTFFFKRTPSKQSISNHLYLRLYILVTSPLPPLETGEYMGPAMTKGSPCNPVSGMPLQLSPRMFFTSASSSGIRIITGTILDNRYQYCSLCPFLTYYLLTKRLCMGLF